MDRRNARFVHITDDALPFEDDSFDAIFSTTHAYPTYTTGLQQAAFEAYLASEAVKNARRVIRPVLSWRG